MRMIENEREKHLCKVMQKDKKYWEPVTRKVRKLKTSFLVKEVTQEVTQLCDAGSFSLLNL